MLGDSFSTDLFNREKPNRKKQLGWSFDGDSYKTWAVMVRKRAINLARRNGSVTITQLKKEFVAPNPRAWTNVLRCPELETVGSEVRLPMFTGPKAYRVYCPA